MTENRPAAGRGVRRPAIDRGTAILLALLLLGGVLYLQHSFQYFMHDDEGGYAYAAWRVSEGEVPYRDFLTPQMPGFLYWGGLIVRLFGRSYVPLRVATSLVMLLAALLLYAVSREVYGRRVALLAMALFMIEPDIFHDARFFRSEACMLLFSLAGIYCLVRSEKRRRPGYLWLGSLFFGLALAFKLFAFLSLAGCYLYLLYAAWQERRPLKKVLRQGVALGLPAALLLGTVALVFYRLSPYFFTAVFEHHTMQGAGLSLPDCIRKGLAFYRRSFLHQPLAVLLAAAGVLLLRRRGLPWLMVCQLPTALAFLFLSRSLMLRHWTYLVPAGATLMAVTLDRLLDAPWLRQPWQRWALAALLALGAVYPWLKRNIAESSLREAESTHLAALVQSLSPGGEPVLTDYPGLNFMAGRRTTYWGAGLSSGAARSGQILGSALIEEIEQEQVGGVVINVLGKDHQLTLLTDYAEFRRYVQSHFALVDRYRCRYRPKELEIYSRTDTMPLQPGINYQDQVAMTGARLPDAEVRAGETLEAVIRWQALAPMPSDYHISLRLVDATGRLWAQADEQLVEQFAKIKDGKASDSIATFGTSTWEPQQAVLRRHRLDVGPSVPSGSYYLVARVYDLASRFALVSRREQGLQLPGGDTAIATVRVASSPGSQPQAIPISEPVVLGEGVQWLGQEALPASLRAGQALPVGLYWQADGAAGQDYELELRLVQGDAVRRRWQVALVEGFPSSTWQPGETLLGHYLLPLDGALAEGTYRLEVQLVDALQQPVGEPQALAGDVQIRARPDPAQVKASITHPLEGLTFGEGIALLGYDLAAEAVRAGDTVELTLYWECLEPPVGDYKVFTHLVDGAGQIRGQRDAIPDNGSAPTSGWMVGDLLADRYPIHLEEAAPPGGLQVEIGFYDPLTWQRLPVLQDGNPTGEDHIVLPARITVNN